MNKTILSTLAVIAALLSGAVAAAQDSPTVASIKSKGFLQCGVSQGLPGFSNPNDQNEWVGIDVDYCRALAAVVVGDANSVRYTPLSAAARFTALQSGEIDVLSRNTTWTMERDVNLGGLEFVGVLYYDGQGFMTREDNNITSAYDLGGATVCTQRGTTTELNLADFFRGNDLPYNAVAFEKADDSLKAYEEGRCDAYTTDRSGLAAEKTKLANPNEHVVLPEIISKEPLGPVVREGDEIFADIVRWTLNALIEAEEYGVTSANIDALRSDEGTPIPAQRIIGVTGDFGSRLGLDKDWAYRAIKQVGNYAEIYDRNVMPLGLARGTNALWTDGGILYAPPIR